MTGPGVEEDSDAEVSESDVESESLEVVDSSESELLDSSSLSDELDEELLESDSLETTFTFESVFFCFSVLYDIRDFFLGVSFGS